MKNLSRSLIVLAFAAGAVQIQAATPSSPKDAAAPDTAAPAPQSAALQAAAPQADSGAPAAAAIAVSDREIDQFAQAVVKLNKINSDPTLDEDSKQDQMAAAVVAIGLDPERYNQIGEAATVDDALRAKVEMAMTKYVQTVDPVVDVV